MNLAVSMIVEYNYNYKLGIINHINQNKCLFSGKATF